MLDTGKKAWEWDDPILEPGADRMKISDAQLDDWLGQWSREYGWGGMPRVWQGVSPMQAIADFHGKAPQVTGFRPQVTLGTVADDVESAVNRMLDIHPIGYMTLRCEYIGRRDRPIEAKLSQLHALGFRLDRDAYEFGLESGKIVLAEMLSAMSDSVAKQRLTAA